MEKHIAMDNHLVRCPYNPCHKLTKLKLAQHLVKCEKKYPPLEICPFNYAHRFPKEKLTAHLKNCPSKPVFYPEDEINIVGPLPPMPYPFEREKWNEDSS